MTKKKLELTQKIIELKMADANRISKKYYDRTATDRQFKKGESVWLYDSGTRKGKISKQTRRWREMTILEKLTDLNYRVCDASTGKVMTSPVHVDRLRKVNIDRDLWYIKYPDTQADDTETLTPQVGQKPQSSVNIPGQSVSNDPQNKNARQTPQTQDNTDTTVDSQDNNLPKSWFKIDRIVAKR
jgi:hypothetical protein